MEAQPSALVRLRAMARIAGVPPSWLKARADAGLVPCLRAGPRRLFDVEATIQSLRAQARQAQPPERPS